MSMATNATPWVRETSAFRRIANMSALVAAGLATVASVAVLVWILGYVVFQGLRHVHLSFFTNVPAPVGERGGGFLNALIGTGIMVGLASLISIPIGVGAGIYLAEFGRGKFARTVRFVAETMNATPSIVAGLFAYGLIVVSMKRFSAIAGAVALSVLMIPTITRTTEEMLRLVPVTLREAALALGASESRTILGVVVKAASPGILTGIMLAVARVSGETAALLFTALNNRFLTTDVDQPMASVPVQVYSYAIAPYEEWHQQAWAGSLVLIALIAGFSVIVRLAARGRDRVG